MNLFRDLSPEEEAVFRKWALQNYEPFTPIDGVWHPVVQDECRRMNEEIGMTSAEVIGASTSGE